MSEYKLLLTLAVSWVLSQMLKATIYCIRNRKFDLARLMGDGGMPSSHSATVVSLATASALMYGLSSFQFAISAALAFIVMHDASGIRFESGKQAQVINEIHEFLKNLSFKSKSERLEEFLGHTPLQVFFGALLGAAVAVAIFFLV